MLERNLTLQEKELLQIIKEKLIAAFKARLEKPDNFDYNINCLKVLKNAVDDLENIVEPHLEKQHNAEKESKKSYFNFFKTRAKNKAQEEQIIIERILKYPFSSDLDELLKQTMEKEPRIVALNYSKHVYKITFSDGQYLSLDSLDSETLLNARTIYTNKMQELVLQRSLKVSP